MLIKIREKAQGVFAWVILIMICVPFALWGIQNYLDVGKETPVVSVGDHDFFQRDVNNAYAQLNQNLTGRGVDEATIKKLALEKLISDEVLLQYVEDQGLTVTDDTVRNFIKTLQYFQVDGKFDKKQYQILLNSQNMSSAQFAAKIRKALIMEQFQQGIINSSFVTKYDVDNFFKIQNQQRNLEYVQIALPKLTEQPNEEALQEYYQQHQGTFKTPERVSIEFIELSLAELAKDIQPSEEELTAFYNDRQDFYTEKERRKISHILFAFTADAEQDETALQRALEAKKRLQTEDFAIVAAELSDDKLTAKQGGDLGLFNVGEMEAALEEAIVALQEGGISNPVKSAFGYHIIKVTEMSPGKVKPLSEVKDDVTVAYQKTAAENEFYELGQTLTEVSYENPDSLTITADALAMEIQTSTLFSRDQGVGIAEQKAVRDAAFDEEVLAGKNSDAIELGAERLVVIRLLEHQPASVKPLQEVKSQVEAAILKARAENLALVKADQLLQQLNSGSSLQVVADAEKLPLLKFPDLIRNNRKLPRQLTNVVFKAAKPLDGKPHYFKVAMPSGEQAVVSLISVNPGKLTAEDKQKLDLAENNIARAFGQAAFNSVLAELEENTDIDIRSQQ